MEIEGGLLLTLLGSESKSSERRNLRSGGDLEEVRNDIELRRRALMYLKELEGEGHVSPS